MKLPQKFVSILAKVLDVTLASSNLLQRAFKNDTTPSTLLVVFYNITDYHQLIMNAMPPRAN